MVKASPWTRLRAQVRSLLNPGRVEIVLSALVIVFLVATELPRRGITATVLDSIAYVFAALTARWPKTGATLVGLYLAARISLPHDAGSFSEYTALIVILGAGMRGNVAMRRVVTAVYFPLLMGVTQVFSPNDQELILGVTVWAVLIAVTWMIGNASHGYTVALRRAHVAEAQLQRQVLARELHDTVARSFTTVAMTAERARLRGGATAEDLDTISDAAGKGVDELRLMMGLLRDPRASIEALHGDSSLADALTAAEKSLRMEGFTVAVSVDGELARLGDGQSAVLAAVTAEAATNVVRHGDPDQPVGIVVRIDDARVELAVINTPAPHDPNASAQPMGLWGMRQRVETAGGTVEVVTEDQHWVVRVGLPVAEPTRAS